jgi:hypothetical protein
VKDQTQARIKTVAELASERMNLPNFFNSVNHAFGLAIMVYIIIIASTIIIMWDPLEIFHDSMGTGFTARRCCNDSGRCSKVPGHFVEEYLTIN